MATNAATYNAPRYFPLFVLPAAPPKKKRGIPNWRQLNLNTRQDLLAVLAQMIVHHVPNSHTSDERGVPDESR